MCPKTAQGIFAEHREQHSSEHVPTGSSEMELFMRFSFIAGDHLISDSLVLKASIFITELYAEMETINNILCGGVDSNRYAIFLDP